MVLILNVLSRGCWPQAFGLRGQNGKLIKTHPSHPVSPADWDWIAPPKCHARSSADKGQRTEIENAPFQVSIREMCGHTNSETSTPRRYKNHIWEDAQAVLRMCLLRDETHP